MLRHFVIAMVFLCLVCAGRDAHAQKEPGDPPGVVEPGTSVFFQLSSTGDVYRIEDNGLNRQRLVRRTVFGTLCPDWPLDDVAHLPPSSSVLTR